MPSTRTSAGVISSKNYNLDGNKDKQLKKVLAKKSEGVSKKIKTTKKSSSVMNSPQSELEKVQLKIVKLNKDVIIPAKKTNGAACRDIYLPYDVEIKPNESIKIALGFKMQIPRGYTEKLEDRSSIGSKRIRVLCGRIDSDYLDEWHLVLENNSKEIQSFKKGDRIATMKLERVIEDEIIEVDEILPEADSNRTGGFGSTGLNDRVNDSAPATEPAESATMDEREDQFDENENVEQNQQQALDVSDTGDLKPTVSDSSEYTDDIANGIGLDGTEELNLEGFNEPEEVVNISVRAEK